MPDSPARPPAAALLLGFALGGFFDGILLHQVLQWHHLLSDVESVRDLRWQLLADGLFHLLMYLLALGALVGLWRARTRLGSARRLMGSALVGFGLWHVVDAVLSHWLTGIHRIRGDAANPLFWDLLWLGLFGVLPLLAGWWMRRGPPDRGDGRMAAAAVGGVALTAALLAAAPAPTGGQAVVVFGPGTTPARAYDALARLDARVRWVDAAGGVWAVEWTRAPAAAELLAHGAWLASGTPLALGCVTASRASRSQAGPLARS